MGIKTESTAQDLIFQITKFEKFEVNLSSKPKSILPIIQQFIDIIGQIAAVGDKMQGLTDLLSLACFNDKQTAIDNFVGQINTAFTDCKSATLPIILPIKADLEVKVDLLRQIQAFSVFENHHNKQQLKKEMTGHIIWLNELREKKILPDDKDFIFPVLSVLHSKVTDREIDDFTQIFLKFISAAMQKGITDLQIKTQNEMTLEAINSNFKNSHLEEEITLPVVQAAILLENEDKTCPENKSLGKKSVFIAQDNPMPAVDIGAEIIAQTQKEEAIIMPEKTPETKIEVTPTASPANFIEITIKGCDISDRPNKKMNKLLADIKTLLGAYNEELDKSDYTGYLKDNSNSDEDFDHADIVFYKTPKSKN